MAILGDKQFVKLTKVDGLLEDQEACGINSILTIIKMIHPKTTITINDLKKIFNYDDEGISREGYRYNKLNARLSKDVCSFKIQESRFSPISDLFAQLSLHIPVPVFMKMGVVDRFKAKFNYSNRQFNWGNQGDLFANPNTHILLLVGYEKKGEQLYFIDPCYQLPYHSEKDLNNKEHMLSMDAKDFYEYTRLHKLFIQVKHSKRLERKIKNQGIAAQKQTKLVLK